MWAQAGIAAHMHLACGGKPGGRPCLVLANWRPSFHGSACCPSTVYGWLQVLNVLAPIQAAKGDLAGAEQMLGSATTLAKSQGDLPTLVTSSRALLALFGANPADAERAAKQREYTQRKVAGLMAAVAGAAAAPGHAALLAWVPATMKRVWGKAARGAPRWSRSRSNDRLGQSRLMLLMQS